MPPLTLTRNRLIGNLANATDSAASSSFLAKGATEANYQSIAYSDVTGKPTILDSAGITSIIDSAYIQARQGSAVAGLDSAGITSIVDSNYVVARAANSGSGYVRYNYTATAGQTVFQDSDNSGALLSYTSGGIMVFYNGVMLKNTSDWAGTDGSSVTLVEAADSGANVSIHKWTVAGGGSGGGASIAWGGDRGIATNGSTIDYFDMTTAANSADFGNTTAGRLTKSGILSDTTYGVHAGGYDNIIDYITIATPSNATDFGDQNPGRGSGLAPMSDGTYGVWAGGNLASTQVNNMDYITIASPSNATDFGDLSTAVDFASGWSDGTYGYTSGNGGSTSYTLIQYITIASPGNATSGGNLSAGSRYGAAASDATYAVVAHGETSSATVNTIDYMTMSTSANGSDFGDLTVARKDLGACGNGTRVAFIGGTGSNVIDYVIVATPGNATDLGDLTATMGITACSGNAS